MASFLSSFFMSSSSPQDSKLPHIDEKDIDDEEDHTNSQSPISHNLSLSPMSLDQVSPEEKKARELVENHLFQPAGKDRLGRQLFCIYACYIPSASETSYDVLLRVLVGILEKTAVSEYSIVLFSGGAAYYPSWSWTFTAYSKFSRNVRKNLKALYVVHPSSWPKFIFNTMGLVVSPKFARKLVWIDTIEELEEYVFVDTLKIPQKVKEIDTKHEARRSRSRSSSARPSSPVNQNAVFGKLIDEVMQADGSLPSVLVDCLGLIEKHTTEEGLFRKSPSQKAVQDAKRAYDTGDKVDVSKYGDVHLACGLVKAFFRELRVPIFTQEMYPVIRSIESSQDKIYFVQHSILPLLSIPTNKALKYLFCVLHSISVESESNKMTSSNLTIVMAPNFVRGTDPLVDLKLTAISTNGIGGGVGVIVKLCIEQYEKVFVNEPEDVVVSSSIEGSGSSKS